MQKRLPFLLLILAAAIIAAATVYEHYEGTEQTRTLIYGTWWFKALWAATALSGLYLIYKYRLWKNLPVFMLHISWACILSGALFTSLWGENGTLHLRQGIPVNSFMGEGKEKLPLPFTLRLDSFAIEHYHGTLAPSNYHSHVSVFTKERIHRDNSGTKVDISMNHTFTQDGYKFYQSSYDEDGMGTLFSVNYDRWGSLFTYVGYVLLGLSMMWMIGKRLHGHIKLSRKAAPGSKPVHNASFFTRRTTLLAPLSAIVYLSLAAFFCLNDDNSALSRTQVVWNGRIAPYGTMAQDFMHKIYGKGRFNRENAENIVSSWAQEPTRWNEEPIILVKDDNLRHTLGIDGKYARFIDFFDSETLRQREWAESLKASVHNNQQTNTSGTESAAWVEQEMAETYKLKNAKPSKATQETDEKVGLIVQLIKGKLIVAAPKDVVPLSECKVSAELFYNSHDWTLLGFICCICMGTISLINVKRTRKCIAHILRFSYLFVLTSLLLIFLLRWYIAEHLPLSNGYETMLFVSIAVLLVCYTLGLRNNKNTCHNTSLPLFGGLGVGAFGAAFMLLVAHISASNPQITPLIPVLQSPWLSAHVSLIMLSYALLALCILERRLLELGVFFLAAGIFLGAVWADESWGTYWSWDPKESWALITLIVYSIPLHKQSIPWFRSDRNFRLYCLIGISCLLMTYFGVNYLLGGLHSYGSN